MGGPLPAAGRDSDAAEKYCVRTELPRAAAVDFWTEASLFSEAGLPALVLGPGNIAQAHVTDEWVALPQLEQVFELYGRLVKSDE